MNKLKYAPPNFTYGKDALDYISMSKQTLSPPKKDTATSAQEMADKQRNE